MSACTGKEAVEDFSRRLAGDIHREKMELVKMWEHAASSGYPLIAQILEQKAWYMHGVEHGLRRLENLNKSKEVAP
jgi:hypothetical protein